jgi:hypothetical protein
MKDTPPEIERMLLDLYMARSPAERLQMASNSFDVAREIIISTLPKGLNPEEFKRQLFQRIYGVPLPDDFFEKQRK